MKKMHNFKPMKAQKGAALVITLAVLLMLTLVAVTATSSNQVQSIMVRNNQFRLLAFNSSYSEIDGQIDALNSIPINSPVPDHIITLLDNTLGAKVSTDKGNLPLYSEVTQDVALNASQTYRGPCAVFGEEIGVGAQRVECSLMRIESNAQRDNTNIQSNQRQLYELLSLL